MCLLLPGHRRAVTVATIPASKLEFCESGHCSIHWAADAAQPNVYSPPSKIKSVKTSVLNNRKGVCLKDLFVAAMFMSTSEPEAPCNFCHSLLWVTLQGDSDYILMTRFNDSSVQTLQEECFYFWLQSVNLQVVCKLWAAACHLCVINEALSLGVISYDQQVHSVIYLLF